MIYCSDDYFEKYTDTLSYLIARGVDDKYSFPFIEKSIAYSEMVNELERSNVTSIAFSSMEKIYQSIFPTSRNDGFQLDVYGLFGWIGTTYFHLFLDLQITFESLFIVLPIEKIIEMYPLYHEMNYSQALDYVKSLVEYTYLDLIMKDRQMSVKELSKQTSIPSSTISALRYGNRDINKLEAQSLLKLSHALDVKVESLLPNIQLVLDNN